LHASGVCVFFILFFYVSCASRCIFDLVVVAALLLMVMQGIGSCGLFFQSGDFRPGL
jgi:hypothetical protein